MKIHCSSLDRLETCPGSAYQAAKVEVSVAGEAARFGTAGHRIVELALQGMLDDNTASAVSLANGFGSDETAEFVAASRHAIEAYGAAPRVLVEQRIEREIIPGIVLSGRFDALTIDHEEAHPMEDEVVVKAATLVDHKFTRDQNAATVDVRAQMAGLATLVFAEHPYLETLHVDIHFPLLEHVSRMTLNRDGLGVARRRVEEILRAVAAQRDHDQVSLEPGVACHFCPAAPSCPARAIRIAEVMALVPDAPSTAIAARPETYPALYNLASQVAKRAESLQDMLKASVKSGGAIHSAFGVLEYRTQNRKASGGEKFLLAWLEKNHPEIHKSALAELEARPKVTVPFIYNSTRPVIEAECTTKEIHDGDAN